MAQVLIKTIKDASNVDHGINATQLNGYTYSQVISNAKQIGIVDYDVTSTTEIRQMLDAGKVPVLQFPHEEESAFPDQYLPFCGCIIDVMTEDIGYIFAGATQEQDLETAEWSTKIICVQVFPNTQYAIKYIPIGANDKQIVFLDHDTSNYYDAAAAIATGNQTILMYYNERLYSFGSIDYIEDQESMYSQINMYAITNSGISRISCDSLNESWSTEQEATKFIADIQINGSSIVSNNVANIPIADWNTLGLVSIDNSSGGYGSGLFSLNGRLYVKDGTTSGINNRSVRNVITSNNLDYAVKAALTDGKGAAYTDAEKTAACTRIGVYDLVGDIAAALNALHGADTETGGPGGSSK